MHDVIVFGANALATREDAESDTRQTNLNDSTRHPELVVENHHMVRLITLRDWCNNVGIKERLDQDGKFLVRNSDSIPSRRNQLGCVDLARLLAMQNAKERYFFVLWILAEWVTLKWRAFVSVVKRTKIIGHCKRAGKWADPCRSLLL